MADVPVQSNIYILHKGTSFETDFTLLILIVWVLFPTPTFLDILL